MAGSTKVMAERTRAGRVVADDAAGARHKVSTLGRAFELLDAFRNAGGPLGNADLAAATGLPKPTISRLAQALVAAGYLEYLPRIRQYQLGYAILPLSRAKLKSIEVRRFARLPMRKMVADLGITVDLSTPVGADVLYLEVVSADSVVSAHVDAGGHNPIDVTAAGRACLAVMTDRELREAYDLLARRRGHDWPRILARIAASLEQVTKLGFCVVQGEFRPENAFAGVAMRDERAGRIYSFSAGVIGPGSAETQEFLHAKIGPRLTQLANGVAYDVSH